jgi:hypothetical protein
LISLTFNAVIIMKSFIHTFSISKEGHRIREEVYLLQRNLRNLAYVLDRPLIDRAKYPLEVLTKFRWKVP